MHIGEFLFSHNLYIGLYNKMLRFFGYLGLTYFDSSLISETPRQSKHSLFVK